MPLTEKQKTYQRAYYQKHAERKKAVSRAAAWNKAHPEKHRAACRANYARNRDKKLDQSKRYRATPKGKRQAQDYRLKRTFNLTASQYEQMFADQGGVCFICHRPETRTVRGKPTLLAVDHNHTTGEVRRLLCHGCNVSLGLLDENPDRMRQLAVYVEQFKSLKKEAA